MDTVNVHLKTKLKEEHRKFREILDLFRAAGKYDYLGFKISVAGIKMGKNKIEAVERFPKSANQHKVR